MRGIAALITICCFFLALYVLGATAVEKHLERISPYASATSCQTILKENRSSKKTLGRVRIASWNLRWFPDGQSGNPQPGGGTDVSWMACTMALLDVQVIALQEVVLHLRGRRAILNLIEYLNQYTNGDWKTEFDNCPDDGLQHVGLLFDTTRVKAANVHTLPSINPIRPGCDHRLRPGLAGYFRFNGGADLHLINVHLDSGTGRRDYQNRQTSLKRLKSVTSALDRKIPDSDFILLGDFNTMGCNKCSPTILAEQEISDLTRTALSIPPGLVRLEPTQSCTGYYRSHGTMLDHVLVTQGMEELSNRYSTEVFGFCQVLSCEQVNRKRIPALSRLSDHCPVVVELLDRDLD